MGDEADQATQGLIHRLGIGEVGAHIGFEIFDITAKITHLPG